MLTLKDPIVTTYKLNCSVRLLRKSWNRRGDCALALKANQENLYDDVVLLLIDPARKDCV
jgi:predicted transposase YbfD/YdcC